MIFSDKTQKWMSLSKPNLKRALSCCLIIHSLMLILHVCRSLAATPAESGYDSDELSQTEKDRRRALEYTETDEPVPVVPEIQEVNVSIPNIAIPRTSDGDVKYVRPLHGMTLTTLLALDNSRT